MTCEDCVTKWSRCICRPESDWDDDQNYTVRTQTDSPSTVQYNMHPIPPDWSDQEGFWNGKSSEKLPFSQCEDWDISNTQEAKMTLIGKTIFTHRTTVQNLNLRHLVGILTLT